LLASIYLLALFLLWPLTVACCVACAIAPEKSYTNLYNIYYRPKVAPIFSQAAWLFAIPFLSHLLCLPIRGARLATHNANQGKPIVSATHQW